jgi:hypothetical protein
VYPEMGRRLPPMGKFALFKHTGSDESMQLRHQ